MIEIRHIPSLHLLTVTVGGHLSFEDYDAALPDFERAIADSDGPLDAVVDIGGLTGIDIRALWTDLKADMRHHDDFRRIAVVGDTRAKEIGTKASTAFTGARVKFFEVGAGDAARAWAMSGRDAAEG